MRKGAIGTLLRLFWLDERAVTALEYSLIGGAVAVSVATGVAAVGSGVSDLFNSVQNVLTP
jgi:Flp pilus assembly pilin Flp